MIGYVTLGTNDLDRSRAFYDALLAQLGAKRIMEFGEDAGGFTMWGESWDKPGIAVTRPYNREAASAGNGNMAALVVDSRNKVDGLYANAMSLGATDEGAPGVRGDEGPQAFYGAYFRDPDGNKLCVFRVGPA
jgi:catechol 2,3-dioxygenase-like lactoylglutathione lyase family enzyme